MVLNGICLLLRMVSGMTMQESGQLCESGHAPVGELGKTQESGGAGVIKVAPQQSF